MSYDVLTKELRSIPDAYFDEISEFLAYIKYKAAGGKEINKREADFPVPRGKSAKGIAAKYANPALIPLEKQAMEKALVERYENAH